MLSRWKPRHWNSNQVQGVCFALLSAAALGLAPTLGKQAINAGTPPLTVVTLRTLLAVAVLWTAYTLLWRKYLYIYPVGLAGCLTAGLFNGLGSLMYYGGLGRLDASLAQLLYTLYPIFLTLFSRLDGHPVSRFTWGRTAIALAAVYLLTGTGQAKPDLLGALLMVGAGAMYAAHLLVNQRVLFDMPAQTVTLYTLTAMSVTVGVAYLLGGLPVMPPTLPAWEAVLWLTLVTVISRLALFVGVKRLGGLQTALLGLSELLITVVSAQVLLGDRLSSTQWLGAGLLAASVLLVVREKGLGVLPEPKPWLQILAARFTQPAPPRPTPDTRD